MQDSTGFFANWGLKLYSISVRVDAWACYILLTRNITFVLCVNSDCRPCVIKIMRKIPDYYDLAKIEVDVLQKLIELDPEGSRYV